MGLRIGKNLKNLFIKKRIYPSKGLGQNFLIDKNVLKKIISVSDLKKTDVILEIGPGTGILTKELAKKTRKVIAIEKDPRLAEFLKQELKENKNVEIIEADALKVKSLRLKVKSYKIVANLPYYITAPIIRMFLESPPVSGPPAGGPPELMVLMVQKEVAQRICAKPPKMNLLAVSVQFYAQPEIISFVSKKSFLPKPKVDSAIIKISPIQPNLARINANTFFKIVKAGFSQPRKKLINNLSKKLELSKENVGEWLQVNKIKTEQRASELSLNDWIKLAISFKEL